MAKRAPAKPLRTAKPAKPVPRRRPPASLPPATPAQSAGGSPVKQLPSQVDVLIVGTHPSAHLAAAILAVDQPKLRTLHVLPPGPPAADRLLPINPGLVRLHPLLGKSAPLAELYGAAGLRFLSDQPGVRSEHLVPKPPALCVGSMSGLTQAMASLVDGQEARCHAAHELRVLRVVDDGVAVEIDRHLLVARTILLAWPGLPIDQQRLLGIGGVWESGVMHRYTFQRFRPAAGVVASESTSDRAHPPVPMSLDLAGSGAWAWMFRHCDGSVQFCVQQAMRTVRSHPPRQLLERWRMQLARHGLVTKPEALPDLSSAVEIDLPFAGALSAETVANRTLLFGPAGGFYSTCGEELYPCCWSAVSATRVVGKALSADHVQDALQAYRADWGATLGDYLRGPQQNLTLLLPLIYRNAVMAARVAEAILFGESVVR